MIDILVYAGAQELNRRGSHAGRLLLRVVTGRARDDCPVAQICGWMVYGDGSERGNAMAILFKIVRDGRDFFCQADGEAKFFVGRRVPYEGNIGLYNIFGGSKVEKLNFNSADFNTTQGFWAEFIEPTALCEGRNFLTLNTYDSAAFTFGFGQFAAHVPNGDFVCYFRKLLSLPNAADYFPHLKLVNGRIHKFEEGSPSIALETDETTKPLMKYLNASLDDVDDSEVIAAAKLIHWTSKHVAARDAQVAQMVDTYKGFMKRAQQRVGIDGRTADLCCVVADILHHGRGGKMTWPMVDEALKSGKPLDSLIAIGAPKWEERKNTLRKALKARPGFAQKVWNAAIGAFV
jgi:hypothetical protein